MAAGTLATLEPTLSQQEVVEHVLRLLQLFGDAYVVVHAENFRTLRRRKILHTHARLKYVFVIRWFWTF